MKLFERLCGEMFEKIGWMSLKRNVQGNDLNEFKEWH